MTPTRRLTRTLHGLDVDPVSMPISGSERVAHRRRRRRRVRGLSRIAARGWRSAPSGTARAFRPMATRQTISVIRSQTGGCLTEPGPRAVPGSLGRSGNYHGHVAPTCFREERMDKPRIFLGSSGKQEKLLQALTRGLEAVAHVDPWTTSFHPGTTTLHRVRVRSGRLDDQQPVRIPSHGIRSGFSARQDGSLSARYWSEAAKEKKEPSGVFYYWKGERPLQPNAPQLDGTGEIRMESADRAAGYFTTCADTHPKVNARTAGVYLRADPKDMKHPGRTRRSATRGVDR